MQKIRSKVKWYYYQNGHGRPERKCTKIGSDEGATMGYTEDGWIYITFGEDDADGDDYAEIRMVDLMFALSKGIAKEVDGMG